jgi:hypothetical protein
MRYLLRKILFSVILLTTSLCCFAQSKDINISLPQNSSILTLKQLSALLQANKINAYVDIRYLNKKILIVRPNSQSTISSTDLKMAMALATGLRWRKINNTIFLTMFDENSSREFLQKQTQRLERAETEIYNHLNKLNFSMLDIKNLKKSTKWSDLSDSNQLQITSLLKNRLDNTNFPADMTVRFGLDVSLSQLINGRPATTTAYSIFR